MADGKGEDEDDLQGGEGEKKRAPETPEGPASDASQGVMRADVVKMTPEELEQARAEAKAEEIAAAAVAAGEEGPQEDDPQEEEVNLEDLTEFQRLALERAKATPEVDRDEELLSIFVGPNDDKYVELFRAFRTDRETLSSFKTIQFTRALGKDSPNSVLGNFLSVTLPGIVDVLKALQAPKVLRILMAALTSFNWAALVLGLPWFLYRKMYIQGAVLFLPALVLLFLFPKSYVLILAAASVASGFVADTVYLATAQWHISRLKGEGLTDDEMNARVRTAGGTWLYGLGVGFAVVVAGAVLPHFVGGEVKLPSCRSPQVHQLAVKLVKDSLRAKGVPVDSLQFSGFNPITMRSDDGHQYCNFRISLGNETEQLFIAITWIDKGEETYRVNVGASIKQALEAAKQAADDAKTKK